MKSDIVRSVMAGLVLLGLNGVLWSDGSSSVVSAQTPREPNARTNETVAGHGSLELKLQQVDAEVLATEALASGDASRGAVLFFRGDVGCAKCHVGDDADTARQSGDQAGTIGKPVGPDLSKLGSAASNRHLVESVLFPSKQIRDGYVVVSVLTLDGRVLTGILKEDSETQLVLQHPSNGTWQQGAGQSGAGQSRGVPGISQQDLVLAREDVEQVLPQQVSIMPTGQINALGGRQEFLDLIRYLIEIRDGGPRRAKELRPAASQLVVAVPDYEQRVDHAGLIRSWDAETLERGEAIYEQVCANCHGTAEQPGSLPTSLRFASGRFKRGHDPYSMYQTLTYGFGFMMPQTWMVPRQKYDVIHYIREHYLKSHNPSQYDVIDQDYLSDLPPGDTFGPEPSKIQPWSAMDYGPSLTHTYQIPGPKENFAYKGIAVRLDTGPGGVARGSHWMVFDTDTLRMAAGWSATADPLESFIDWRGIQFDGAHGVHPRIVGNVAFRNSTGPGWADPETGTFVDQQRVLGRDGKRYGPLPKTWARFLGIYHHVQRTVFSYQIGDSNVLESPSIAQHRSNTGAALLTRTFNLGPRDRDLRLQVAEHHSKDAEILEVGTESLSGVGATSTGSIVRFGLEASDDGGRESDAAVKFDGETYLEIKDGSQFDMNRRDFSISARIKTTSDGTIFALTQPGPEWVPNGQTFFVRGGRLGFDIGWVGAVSGNSKVADGQWHVVRVSWENTSQTVKLYVDGSLDGEGRLAAKRSLENSVGSIGYTSPDFPRKSFFRGEMDWVEFSDGMRDANSSEAKSLVWRLKGARGQTVSVADIAGTTLEKGAAEAIVHRGGEIFGNDLAPLIAAVGPDHPALSWEAADERLILRIAAGAEPLRFTLYQPAGGGKAQDENQQTLLSEFIIEDPSADLKPLTQGGASRWGQILQTALKVDSEEKHGDLAAFAIDELESPAGNPWLARTRFTGLDFYRDGRLAVCSWDGDVWTATVAEQDRLVNWRRIASGLFQPLGLRIVDDKIHVTCRDQLVVLHDFNGDQETDFYECFNNDHQVTEHFHEFAMGLQTDDEGNFYYAKSGQHGLAAIVPHHGTLLKVKQDGSETSILANGFRAANGVCLNPDGTFFVSDQEGFWNPKNRINWVVVDEPGEPKFYGNMLGYHHIKDSSDCAMEQPLCWITNAMDRSPGELLWVDSPKWGALDGALLNLSYGYGRVFLVLHQRVGEQMQGGVIQLPINDFPTGVMRGRFDPINRDLHLCGMFAWAGNATQPGGLYRLRPTGNPHYLPTELRATARGLELKFSEPIDALSATPASFNIKVWDLKRTANYGSKHFGERMLDVRDVSVSDDRLSLLLDVAGLEPTWCMEVVYNLRAESGEAIDGKIHNTIHELEN